MAHLLEEKYQLQKKYSLCLIEDDLKIGDWLINKLKGNERISSLHWAKNFRESENHINNELPNVVILDLKLPDGNGIDILKGIKSKNLDIKVFVFSSNAAFKNVCLRLGAKGFFDKSSDGEKLIDTLKYFKLQ